MGQRSKCAEKEGEADKKMNTWFSKSRKRIQDIDSVIFNGQDGYYLDGWKESILNLSSLF